MVDNLHDLWRKDAAQTSHIASSKWGIDFRRNERLGIRLIPAGRPVADSLNLSVYSPSAAALFARTLQ